MSSDQHIEHIQTGQQVSRHSLPTLCFLFFSYRTFFLINWRLIKFQLLILLFLISSITGKAQFGRDSLLNTNLNDRISFNALKGIWYSTDTKAHEVEFVAYGDIVAILQRMNGTLSYSFQQFGDSVSVWGTMPNWPPFYCILNLLDNKKLEIKFYQYLGSREFHSVTYSAVMPITHTFLKDPNSKGFPKGVPFCVGYSHKEQVDFGAIYHTTKMDGELTDVFESNENFVRDSSQLLNQSFVKQHLLPDTKFIYTIDDISKDTLLVLPLEDYLNSDFYAGQLVLHSYMYYAVIYE